MKDYSGYSMVELEELSETAFSEYFRLAIVPCPYQPPGPELERLQKATDAYEEILEEIAKRLSEENH